MYFSENLEYCTMTDVSFCEDGVGMERELLFIVRDGRGHDLPHPRRSLYTPPVEATAPSAPGRTAQHRQQRAVLDARQTAHSRPRTDTHARTLDTLHRVDRNGGGAGGLAVCPIGHAQTDKIIVNKNIHFLCVNLLTKEIKLFTI